ncbi:MAG: diaminopimelate decarboxylase [Rikenellaceae bacterium]|jgi:diaminopimelate decarboxylase|nr:diaminopimelate decarboxylase [Rikenellaceae bacterium]
MNSLPTPFYLYDVDLLRATLDEATSQAARYGYQVHYALKANFNRRILALVNEYGLGADCVSGGEVQAALDAGIPASKIVFAGVAKSDEEIALGLRRDIFSFNCESLQEMEVINDIAGQTGRKARIALRINPDVDPHTHKYISTGKAENKFGIPYAEVDKALGMIGNLSNLEITGLHFHVGSQIRYMKVFADLCLRVNELQEWFASRGLQLSHINVGGGLGINYDDPAAEPIPDFKGYFAAFASHLKLRPGQTLHFEPGRSIVGQCGRLITRVLYNKVTPGGKHIALVDAGMTELIRPALYQARHRIENLTASPDAPQQTYTVGGPICESSDIFASDITLPVTRRGDMLAIMSAGAYGRAMSSNYNLRNFVPEIFTDELP